MSSWGLISWDQWVSPHHLPVDSQLIHFVLLIFMYFVISVYTDVLPPRRGHKNMQMSKTRAEFLDATAAPHEKAWVSAPWRQKLQGMR